MQKKYQNQPTTVTIFDYHFIYTDGSKEDKVAVLLIPKTLAKHYVYLMVLQFSQQKLKLLT